MAASDQFDTILLGVAQRHRGIDDLLDTVFGFLRKRTDFFTGPGGLDGARTSVNKALERQLTIVSADAERKEAAKKKEAAKQAKLLKKRKAREAEEKKKADAAAAAALAAAAERAKPAAKPTADVVELDESGSFDLDAAVAPEPSATSAGAPASASEESGAGSGTGSATADATPADADTKKKGEPGVTELPEEEDEEEDGPKLEGNGGTTDRYKWTQTLSEVVITFPVPAGTKGKMVVCDYSRTKVKVGLKGSPMLVDSKFHKPVKADDAYWTLEDAEGGSRQLVLYLTKENQMEWWNCIAEGEPVINTKRVEPENSKLGDLDAETRQTVEKMMFDQRAKAMGMPTSAEREKQSVLEKFMKSHPEMDFSKAKIN